MFHLHISRRAMATDFQILLPRSAAPAEVDAAVGAMELLEPIEATLTIYQNDSEASRINREGSQGPVRVGPMMIDILQRAARLSAATDGAFDVTAGPLVDAWGFTTRSGRRPSAEQIQTARARVGWQRLEIDPQAGTVRFAVPDMRVNFGAIGKGYALDRIAQRLHEAGVNDFLLHGGNSSVTAAGDAEPGSGEGWRVGLQHPTRPRQRLGGIVLRDMSLATSGSGKRHFHFRGRRYGHVIDPRSGYPAGEFLSLSVLTSQATDADAIATGLFVGGRAMILRNTAHSPAPDTVIPGVIAVAAAEREGSVEVETWNVPESVWQATVGAEDGGLLAEETDD